MYPELVIHDAAGQIQSVRYDELAPMLLNEMQKQQQINAARAQQNAEQAAKIAAQASEISDLKQQQQTQYAAQAEHAASQDAEIRDLTKLVVEMQAGLLKLKPKGELVAQR